MYHRLGGLSNRHLLIAVLEAGKPKIRVSVWLDSGKGPVSDLLMAAFLLYLIWWRETEQVV